MCIVGIYLTVLFAKRGNRTLLCSQALLFKYKMHYADEETFQNVFKVNSFDAHYKIHPRFFRTCLPKFFRLYWAANAL